MHRPSCLLAAALACGFGCGSGAGAGDGGTVDGNNGVADGPAGDGAIAIIDAATADAAVFDPGPEPTAPIQPVAGEVTILQLALPVGITVQMGEAAIVVGPDGTLVVIDVGNSGHDDELRAAIVDLNQNWLTPAHGFPARNPRQVDWIVLTHLHGDHVGGFEKLMVGGAEPLELTFGVVHRGLVDLGEAMNTSDYQELCAALAGSLAAADRPLCQAAAAPSCVYAELGQNYPATGCPGLFLGDLADAGDDSEGAPSFIALGGGARLTFTAADGFVSNGVTATAGPAIGYVDANQENARSLAGVISHGQFRYQFAADMTGSGDDTEPDVESHYVATAVPHFLGALGADATHAGHHARGTSSNSTFVAALAPGDGHARNVIAGINGAHIGSPYQEVLDRWCNANRLGGGRFWVTETTLGAGSHDLLTAAAGPVIIQTIQHGLGYRVQAAGAALSSMAFPAVRD